jgi:protein-disulfide isomerase
MKRFYVVLAAVCLAGGAWLWYASQRRAGEAATAPAPVPVATDSFPGYTLGSDSAPVTIVEYSDFECPFCAAFATVQMPEIRAQLIATGKVRWRHRDFPLSSHKYSRTAALAAQCAGAQGKFWEMENQLFFRHQWAQSNDDPSATFRGFAKDLGLDLGRYDACMDTKRYAGRIEASLQEGLARGVTGTPTFFINGRRYDGRATSDALKATVDSLLARRRH